MLNVELRDTAEDMWTKLPPIAIGQTAAAPTMHALVSHNGKPVMRIDVHAQADDPFREAIVWGSFIVIAFGDRIHFVSIPTRTVASYPVATYVGHFYAVEGRLIVTDRERIHCFDHTGTQLWKSVALAAHGVVIHRIEGDRIEGQGEWETPYGWQSFKVHLWSGMLFDRGEIGERLSA
ncbi:MAG TPA: hypothetical protein VF407_13110 [Polyangiaceae bacterium]